MNLNGKVAVVTGAARGIGKAIAEALAHEGASLVLNARTTETLEELASTLRARGVLVETVAGDVGDEAVASKIIDRTIGTFGRLDVLVNNAGIGHLGPLEKMPPSEFDRVCRTNLRGPFLLMRAGIPHMRTTGGGTIVNIASLAGVNPVPQRAVYAATKWALIGLSRSVLQEVRRDGIRVLVIEPGSTLTDFGHDPSKLENAEKLVKPEDVAAVIISALKLPARAMVSEIEIRPTDPP